MYSVAFIVGGIYRPSFIQLSNIGILLLLASFVGITAAGQTFVILIGGIDLSVPWTLNAMAVLLTTVSLGLNSRAW
jgi:ribose transport system permease protein